VKTKTKQILLVGVFVLGVIGYLKFAEYTGLYNPLVERFETFHPDPVLPVVLLPLSAEDTAFLPCYRIARRVQRRLEAYAPLSWELEYMDTGVIEKYFAEAAKYKNPPHSPLGYRVFKALYWQCRAMENQSRTDAIGFRANLEHASAHLDYAREYLYGYDVDVNDTLPFDPVSE